MSHDGKRRHFRNLDAFAGKFSTTEKFNQSLAYNLDIEIFPEVFQINMNFNEILHF